MKLTSHHTATSLANPWLPYPSTCDSRQVKRREACLLLGPPATISWAQSNFSPTLHPQPWKIRPTTLWEAQEPCLSSHATRPTNKQPAFHSNRLIYCESLDEAVLERCTWCAKRTQIVSMPWRFCESLASSHALKWRIQWQRRRCWPKWEIRSLYHSSLPFRAPTNSIWYWRSLTVESCFIICSWRGDFTKKGQDSTQLNCFVPWSACMGSTWCTGKCDAYIDATSARAN